MIGEEIGRWFEEGGTDFDRGFSLLEQVHRNFYFLGNIKRRRDMGKLRHELNKYYLTGVPIIKKAKAEVKEKAEEKAEAKAEIKGEKDSNTDNYWSIIQSSEFRERDLEFRVQSYDSVGLPDGHGVASPDDKRLVRNDRVILRKEFPFLERDDCPEEFKILVADMITAHTKYTNGHSRLFDVAHKDNDTCFKAAAEVVENYIDNRDMWNELEHYQKTGNILGEHRIFAEKKRRDEIDKMGFEELQLLKTNIQRRVAYRMNQVKKNPNDERIKDWLDEVLGLKAEKKLVEIRIGSRTRKAKTKKDGKK